MQLASGQLTQTHKIKETRRAIAQLKSVLKRKKVKLYERKNYKTRIRKE